MNVESISKVGASTKYKYTDGTILYELADVRINVNGDSISVNHQQLDQKDPQSKYKLLFGQITIQYGTSTAEEYVEYLIENGFFLPVVGIGDSEGETVNITNSGLDVNVQDQHTKPVIAKMSTLDVEDTLLIATVLDDLVITVNDGTGFLVGQYLSIFDIVSNRFYVGYILNVATDDLTLDTPVDFPFPIGSFVTGGSTDMAVNGAVTPVVFALRNTTQTIGQTMDVVRMIFTVLSSTAADFNEFGDLTALTNGIVFRKVDGTYWNIFNLKTNGELAGIMYDINNADAVNPNLGQNGYVARLTFGGQSKIGVVLRLAPGEDAQLIVQDDLSGLDLMEIVLEGHIVEY